MTTDPVGELQLFGLARSVYTRIARLALEEKGLAYSLNEVEIFGSGGVPPDHFQRHPFGRIPVLQHDELMLYETSAITRYVDEAFAGPPLQSADPRERALTNQIIGILDAYAYRPMVWGVFVQLVRVPLGGGVPDRALIKESLAATRVCLSALARLWSRGGFAAGDAISLADLHAYPMFAYLALAPEGAVALDAEPALRYWLARMRGRASVIKTLTPYEAPP